ncbi:MULTISPECIES: hypothetical protein [Butyricimonas]|nr:hypothetical protein [Butyricimonas paravirosa]MBS7199739.1 hypothetical protein [Bacteroidales bacterium]
MTRSIRSNQKIKRHQKFTHTSPILQSQSSNDNETKGERLSFAYRSLSPA